MQYILYNATKNVRLPGEFEYQDVLFTRSSFGRILRMLLDTEWREDRIAILPTDKWEADRANLEKAGITHDPVDAPLQNIVFNTFEASIPKFVACDSDYIEFDTGTVYGVNQNKTINRFDALVPLISIDPPPHLMETFYVEMNGLWAFKPLHAEFSKPDGEDLSGKYDIENFYRNFTNDIIRKKINDIEIPKNGLWVGDLIELIER